MPWGCIGLLLHSRDVLPVLASLSGLWQARELDVTTALARDLPITIATLEDLIVRPGQSFLQLPAFISEIETGGHVVRTQAGGDEAWLETYRKKWLRSLVDHLQAYFPNMPLMLAVYTLLNPHATPQVSQRSVYELLHGGSRQVCDHFASRAATKMQLSRFVGRVASLEIDAQIKTPKRNESKARLDV